MLRRFRQFFITTLIGGLLVILPITILILLINLLFTFVQEIIQPISNVIDFGKLTNQWIINLISFSIIIGFLFLVGLIVQTQIGKRLFNAIEKNWLNKLPFYSTIKETVQQFSGRSKTPFSQVVLVDVFGSDTRMTGFITDEIQDNYYTVFVPTGPNPTNGFIFHVPPERIEFLDVKTEEAMRSIIAVGSGSSKFITQI